MKSKARFVAMLEDAGLEIKDGDEEYYIDQFDKIKEYATAEDFAKQLVYNRARGSDVQVLPENEQIVYDGAFTNFVQVLKKIKRVSVLPDGKKVHTKRYIGRSGRPHKPKKVTVTVDDNGDVVKFEEYKEALADIEPDYEDVIVPHDDKPTYSEVETKTGLLRIKRQIRRFIVGNIRERFKEMAVYHSKDDVHEMATFLIRKIKELESEYTS